MLGSRGSSYQGQNENLPVIFQKEDGAPPQQLQTAQNKSEQDAAIYKEFPEVKMVLADATPMGAPKTIGTI